MYVFTTAQKTLLYIIIVFFSENASFKSYGVICLPRLPLTSYSRATKRGMTLLFAVLTKNDLFRSYSTFVYLLCAHMLNINTCTYITSAHGHELSWCVRADAYNLILIFASYYYDYTGLLLTSLLLHVATCINKSMQIILERDSIDKPLTFLTFVCYN